METCMLQKYGNDIIYQRIIEMVIVFKNGSEIDYEKKFAGIFITITVHAW